MKTLFKILVGMIFLPSCHSGEDGKERMELFTNKYRQPFINSDLPKFNFDPHIKFESNSISAGYRIFRRSDNKLMISLWTDRNSLDTLDKIQKFIAHYVDYVNFNKDILHTG